MNTHVLKTHPEYWDAVQRGEKTFEVRFDDRGFMEGDMLVLVRYDPAMDAGRPIESLPTCRVRVGFIFRPRGETHFGVLKGYLIMSISRIDVLPGLSAAELERLAIVVEESAEVIHAAMKVVRHGYDSHHPDQPGRGNNRDMLTDEIGHAHFAAMLLHEAGDISAKAATRAIERKERSIRKYLHHQGPTK